MAGGQVSDISLCWVTQGHRYVTYGDIRQIKTCQITKRELAK